MGVSAFFYRKTKGVYRYKVKRAGENFSLVESVTKKAFNLKILHIKILQKRDVWEP